MMSLLQQHPMFYGENRWYLIPLTAASIMYNHNYNNMYDVILSVRHKGEKYCATKKLDLMFLNPILMPVLWRALRSRWD